MGIPLPSPRRRQAVVRRILLYGADAAGGWVGAEEDRALGALPDPSSRSTGLVEFGGDQKKSWNQDESGGSGEHEKMAM